jgi:hypothetical protein
MDGSSTGNQPGVYGTLGAPAAGNVPGPHVGAASWTDLSGNLWLFGGYGSDANGNWNALNDLWEYTLPNNLAATATPSFLPALGTYTSAQTITINDATGGATIYYTTNGTTPTASSTAYSGPITISSTEIFEAIAVVT